VIPVQMWHEASSMHEVLQPRLQEQTSPQGTGSCAISMREPQLAEAVTRQLPWLTDQRFSLPNALARSAGATLTVSDRTA
jgi:hypothetical protein